MNKYILILIFSANLFSENNIYHSDASYNALGQTGLIYIPSAEIHSDKSIYMTFNRNEFWKIGTLTATPFNWMEASYFYYRPDDLLWGSQEGLYLDKGFNVKLTYKPKKINFPRVAIGLDDFAGTGQFTKEYIISTFETNSIKFSFGLGWGKFTGESSFSNPISYLIDDFKIRPMESSSSFGGTPETKKWFRGNASFIGGIEYRISNANELKLKLEFDPYDYNKFSCCGEGKGPESNFVRQKDSNINIGLSYPIKNYGNFDIAFVKGNTLSISFSLGITSKKNKIKREKFKPKIKKNNIGSSKKDIFYRDLLDNLASNNIFLQTANLNKDNASLTIQTPDLRNHIQAAFRTAKVTKDVADNNGYKVRNIDVGNISWGIENNNIKVIALDLKNFNSQVPELIKRNTSIKNIKPYDYRNDEFKPLIKFPIFFNSINPDIRTHVGSPQKFLYSGFGFSLDNEIQFSRNIVLTSSLGFNISNNFDEKISDPNSISRHVRTEVLDYLQEGDIYLKRMQLDYIFSPKKNIYTKISAGILEDMYGGIGFEFLYKPFESNFSIGYDFYSVKRRTYEQRFKFLDEPKIKTDHINFSFMMFKPEILIKYSYGNYLAGDKGYTLDLSRVSDIGWKAGFYFTRTDMSFITFGEGSFDKGFYFSIPNDVLFKSFSKGNIGFGLKTMTRDGGQKLFIHNKLEDIFTNSNRRELNMGWYGFDK